MLWIHEDDACRWVWAERSVMDEESDLEEIKGCQKLLYHQTCFRLWHSSHAFMERVYCTCWKSFPGCELLTLFSKMAAGQRKTFSLVNPKLISRSVDVNKIRPELPARSEDPVSAQVDPSFPALHWDLLRFIVKGGSVLRVMVTTEFTSEGRMHKPVQTELTEACKQERRFFSSQLWVCLILVPRFQTPVQHLLACQSSCPLHLSLDMWMRKTVITPRCGHLKHRTTNPSHHQLWCLSHHHQSFTCSVHYKVLHS